VKWNLNLDWVVGKKILESQNPKIMAVLKSLMAIIPFRLNSDNENSTAALITIGKKLMST
jgi:hypothetical protein